MHIHIIGIAGAMTASLAIALKKQGHYITGSDQDKIYPPISTILEKADIKPNTSNITEKIDLAIIGSSFKSFESTKDEFEQIKKLNIPYISATQYIAQNIAKKNSILIAGSFGKTTITSLLVWIFHCAQKNPSCMIGGDFIDDFDSTQITNSDWSIIEADESIHGLDEQAKFLYYPSNHLLLTTAEWEHKDCYPTESANFDAFKKLVQNIPQSGTLLVNDKGYRTRELSQQTNAKVFTYNGSSSDYQITQYYLENNRTQITIQTPLEKIDIETSLIGKYNFENILAAVALSHILGIDTSVIKDAVMTFKGIKRRLELISDKNQIPIFDDFAQSSSRVESALEALKLHYPDKNIKVFYQPHASFLQYKKSLNGFHQAFKNASEVVVGKLKFNPNIDKNDRVTARDFLNEIGDKAIYLPLDEDILNHYYKSLSSKDILIYMSSGGAGGNQIINQIINNLNANV